MLEAIMFKRMGVSKGFPDVEVPLPRNGFHGFYVEMKREKGGKVSPEQEEWLNYLRNEGYFAEVAYGCQHAQNMFLEYIALPEEISI
jgi:VRR-NUC domain